MLILPNSPSCFKLVTFVTICVANYLRLNNKVSPILYFASIILKGKTFIS